MSAADEAMESMMRSLKEKSGKSIDEWVTLAKKSGAAKHGELVAHLKSEHGLTHGYANLVAHQTFQSSSLHADGADLIAAQYAGKKAGLKPVYDLLMEKISAFGEDLEVSPKKGYVSLRRKKQFSIVQPSTADRLDVGINMKGAPATGRLEASGSWNAMVSHRVRVTSMADVDAELVGWLKKAYDAS